MDQDEKRIKDYVKDRYGNLSKQVGSCCSSSCCGPETVSKEAIERAMNHYLQEDLQDLPSGATEISLGCGNPTALLQLKEGDVVLDLGSGGGIDCFIAAKRVGDNGKVIGVDMTPEMVELARRNVSEMGVTNVEFRLGEIESLPVEDESVDVIISNCVINLSPDKDAVFKEAHRVLRPGGKLCVSDIVTIGELPEEIRNNLEMWSRCVAGAIDKEAYLDKIKEAGFAIKEAEDHSSAERKNVVSIGVSAEKTVTIERT
ncbi:arsenite methyltransferase [Chloroflexota bacterium]